MKGIDLNFQFILNQATVGIHKYLNSGAEGGAGPHHHGPVHGPQLHHCGGRQRCIDGMGNSVCVLFKFAREKIIHKIQVGRVRGQFVLETVDLGRFSPAVHILCIRGAAHLRSHSLHLKASKSVYTPGMTMKVVCNVGDKLLSLSEKI